MRPYSMHRETSMDVARPARAPWRVRITLAAAIALIVALAVAWNAVSKNSTAGIRVDRTTFVTAVARLGTIDRSIVASGVLVSESVRIVAASEPGIVTAVPVKPGTIVNAGDVIAKLDNPDIEAAVIDAQSALAVAQAQLMSAREQSRASALAQQSLLASAQAHVQEDETDVQSLDSLHRGGLIADSTYRIATIRAAQSQRQLEINRAQVGVDAVEQQAKIAAAQAQVDQSEAQLTAREAQVRALVVRAGAPGVVQSVNVDPGAHVDVGGELARVADQRALQAVLQVPESQVHAVLVGMHARIDTGNGIVIGRVARIAPSAQSGSVAADVNFNRSLPPGARPDLNVDGTIELERILHALSIARPADAADNTTITLFRITSDGSRATPVRVHLGRGSIDRVQVLSGLFPGDTVIVSDTSAYIGQPALRLY